MVENNKNGNGISESRLSKLENEVGHLVLVQHQQGENIASLMTAIDNQSNQIQSLLHKTGKPFPVNNILAVISLMVVLTGLALAPLYRGMDLQHKLNDRLIDHLIEDAYQIGNKNADLEWLKKIDQRKYEDHK